MNDTSFISSNSQPLVSRCDGAECRSIPVACECVSVFEESWSGGEGGAGRGGAGRRGDGRAEWAGLAVGVIGMSGSKIWDEAGPRGLRGPGDLRLHSENKHRRHLQAAVWGRGVGVWSWVVVLGGGEGREERRGGVGGGLAEWTQSALCFHKTCGMWEQKQMCLI